MNESQGTLAAQAGNSTLQQACMQVYPGQMLYPSVIFNPLAQATMCTNHTCKCNCGNTGEVVSIVVCINGYNVTLRKDDIIFASNPVTVCTIRDALKQQEKYFPPTPRSRK